MQRCLTYHAIERWWERVGRCRRGVIKQALLDAVELMPPLLWQYVGQKDLGSNEFLLHEATGAVFACSVDGNVLTATTVLPAGCRTLPKPKKGPRRSASHYDAKLYKRPYKRTRVELEDE